MGNLIWQTSKLHLNVTARRRNTEMLVGCTAQKLFEHFSKACKYFLSFLLSLLGLSQVCLFDFWRNWGLFSLKCDYSHFCLLSSFVNSWTPKLFRLRCSSYRRAKWEDKCSWERIKYMPWYSCWWCWHFLYEALCVSQALCLEFYRHDIISFLQPQIICYRQKSEPLGTYIALPKTHN